MLRAAVNNLFVKAKSIATSAQRRAYGVLPLASHRKPSSAVVWACKMLEKHNRPLNHAVDAGCGRGRNSLYLAHKGVQVTSFDFTPAAIAALKAAAAENKLGDKIRPLVYDVTEGWPVQEHSVDLVVDVFCFKHITGREARLAYKQNIVQALDPRGALLIAFAGIGDGYYGQYITQHCGDGSALCIDPTSNVQSVLFTRDHVREFFSPEFRLLEETTTNTAPVEDSESPPRTAHAMLFEHNLKVHGGGYNRIVSESPVIEPRFYGKFSPDDR